VERKRNVKYVKTGKLKEIREEILQNRGEIINFPKQGEM